MANEKNAAPAAKEQKMQLPNMRTLAMVFVLIALWVVFSIMTSGSFIQTRNISNLLRQAAFTGIMGVGMSMVIITTGIDLSAGMIMGFIGCVMAALQVWQNVPTPAVILIGLVLGIVIGLIIGLVISRTGMPPFIVTLGTQLIFRGGMLWLTGGQTIAPFHESYLWWGTAYTPVWLGWIICAVGVLGFLVKELRNRKSKEKYGTLTESMGSMLLRWIVISGVLVLAVYVMNDFRGIPIPVLVTAVVALIFTFVTQNTTFGRSIYAIGGNIAAARYAGINVKRNLTMVYVLNSFLCAVAAVVYTARLGGGTAQVANGNYELDAIASSVIGGVSMTGGTGRVSGAILGAIIMMTIDNGMSLMNLDAYWQFIVKGFIIVFAVLFDLKTKKN